MQLCVRIARNARTRTRRSAVGPPAGGIIAWQSLGPGNIGGRTRALVIDPTDPDILYAGTELGVFASDDGGQTWQPANPGMAHTVVETLDWKDENTLVAFTHGRGAAREALRDEKRDDYWGPTLRVA